MHFSFPAGTHKRSVLINKPSVDGSSELDFILFTGSVWAKLQQAQLVLQVESCSCGGPMRRAAVGMQQKEFKVETLSARTTRVLRVQEKYCPLITASLPQGGHFTQWSCDQLEQSPLQVKGQNPSAALCLLQRFECEIKIRCYLSKGSSSNHFKDLKVFLVQAHLLHCGCEGFGWRERRRRSS